MMRTLYFSSASWRARRRPMLPPPAIITRRTARSASRSWRTARRASRESTTSTTSSPGAITVPLPARSGRPPRSTSITRALTSGHTSRSLSTEECALGLPCPTRTVTTQTRPSANSTTCKASGNSIRLCR
ncbi:hypothetical protein G6F64_014709 [Rhizopus arrhizus]|uniref:Uncharacterized protein n=1 Tax=Rhizopus oryzae TaxID=64495 RepID=A0A9P6WSY2_RHIOR|nr:hypothetical protein G6F64_014709 [Rhizopus arrhizus]